MFGRFEADQHIVCYNDQARPPPLSVYPLSTWRLCPWLNLSRLPPLFLHIVSDEKLDGGEGLGTRLCHFYVVWLRPGSNSSVLIAVHVDAQVHDLLHGLTLRCSSLLLIGAASSPSGWSSSPSLAKHRFIQAEISQLRLTGTPKTSCQKTRRPSLLQPSLQQRSCEGVLE